MTQSQAISALLAQCAEDKGVVEVPRGSNRGPRVNAMLRNTGLGPGYPWCSAAVATWGIEALGKLWPVPRTADCDAILGWARRKGVLRRTDPQPGDIFLKMRNSDDAVHTGTVVRPLANGQILAWEANTNDGGSRDGYGVFQRRRSIDGLWFVRWVEELDTDPEESTPRLLETPAYPVWISPYGLFPKIVMRSGRPCAPVRALVAAILGTSLEATTEVVGWQSIEHLPTVRGTMLPSAYLVSDQYGRATAWAPVREIGEALGCVVSAGQLLDDAKTATVTIGPAPKQGEK